MPLPVPEHPYDAPVELTLSPTPSAVERHTDVTLADLPAIFDGAYARIAEQVTPSGPAYALYRGDPSTRFDVEVGFPVAQPAPADLGSEIPGGSAYALSHVGGYDGLGAAWQRLIGASGAAVAMLEVYVTEPTPDADPATMRTDLYAILPST